MAANNSSKKTIKVAVTMNEESTVPFLGQFTYDTSSSKFNDSLKNFIKGLCNHFRVDHPEDFGLQYIDSPNHYVSLGNKDERLKDGVLLMLSSSASRVCERIVKNLLNGNSKEKGEELLALSKYSNDPLLAEEFIKLQGMVFLTSGIEEGRFEMQHMGNALTSFIEIMDQGLITWDTISQQFIIKIVSFINVQNQSDWSILQTSLAILESVLLNNQKQYTLVENMITLPHLLQHIGNSKIEDSHLEEVQQAVIALVNALYLKAEPKKKMYFFSTLTTRQYRHIFNEHILSIKKLEDLGTEMKHQLYVMQQLLLNNYKERMMTPIDPRDQNATKCIAYLQSVAFEETKDSSISKDVTIRRMEVKNENKKLGFKDEVNPINDFSEAPPGVLALDNMNYFARTHSDLYSKLVMENCYRVDSHECPLGRASIELTKLICEILKVGEEPTEHGQTFYPMLLAHDHFFEELFSICLVVFNKTWKEMKATTEDFSKVLSVIRIQITRTMSKMCSSLDRFQDSIHLLDYTEVTKILQEELIYLEKKEMQAPPIVELTKKIREEMTFLVQQNRLNFLVEGTRFQLKSRSSKEKKYQYWRLSPNHKFFHFGTVTSTNVVSGAAVPPIEELSDKISASDIKDIVTGKDCPSKKENRKSLFPFTLLLEDNRSYDFDAPDEKTFHCWHDGINALIRRPMVSAGAEEDLKLLVDMELKLRLLDVEGVQIPHTAPAIPPLPSNYNFSYQVI